MTDSGTKLLHHRTVFDGWRSISLSVYMALVGYGVLVGIPVISTAWVNLLGFTEVQVGRVAGADLGGLSVGAILTALVIARINRRYLFGLLFLGWLPSRPIDKGLDIEIDVEEGDAEHHNKHVHIPAYVPWLVLAAVLATYINIGAYWTYIELASVASDATPEWVSKVLVWASFLSIVGCLFATVLSNRFGLARPLRMWTTPAVLHRSYPARRD